MTTYRPVRAFLVAPLIVPFVVALAVWVAWLVEGRAGDFTVSNALEVIPVSAVFGLPLIYLGEVLLGIPAWLLFKLSVTAFARISHLLRGEHSWVCFFMLARMS